MRRPELTVMEMLHDSCEHCDQARIDVLKGLVRVLKVEKRAEM